MQNGTITRRGHWWFLRFYQPRPDGTKRQKAVKLVRFSRDYPDADAVRNAGFVGKYVNPINTKTAPPTEDLLVADYIEHVYLPWVEKNQKPSTLKNYGYRFQLLKPHLGKLTLKNTEPANIKTLLEAVGRRPTTLLRHLKAFLSGVFRQAALDGKTEKHAPNPVHAARIPEGDEPGEGRHYTLEEIKKIIKVLPEPAKTVVTVAAFSGLRIGELAALCWEDIVGNELHVKRAIWRGHLGTVKTKKSRAPVPLLPIVQKALEAHRKRSVGDFIFCGEKSGKPLVMENLLARKILPALEGANIQWRGWHAFRRGLATNLSKLGIDILTISRLMRHGNIGITEQAYVMPVPQSAQKAMREFERAFKLA
jgi:integrase